ncbi:hypothetical protein JSE7799_00385 [Jannaschia seosinensis]|uniref:Uncharacterized protein n=1 Tax=Jannaschia seosinensis TaxID=313367 RepID=A0A0M7B4U1_9RHOB|nr:YnfA family protein [Jannaschia seosinensis]CUH17317.1 hypothetical protein JSE7799_00385 [Jannaschia seosinensis]
MVSDRGIRGEAGCFAFWTWARLDKSLFWLIPGIASLALFAWVLTRANTALAGRTYAAYGGVYIASSMLWMWLVEGRRPDRWDAAGLALCLIGSAVILLPQRS